MQHQAELTQLCVKLSQHLLELTQCCVKPHSAEYATDSCTDCNYAAGHYLQAIETNHRAVCNYETPLY